MDWLAGATEGRAVGSCRSACGECQGGGMECLVDKGERRWVAGLGVRLCLIIGIGDEHPEGEGRGGRVVFP